MADIVYMAKSAWTALLDAIRSKGGTSALMTAAQAKAAVEAIETGGGQPEWLEKVSSIAAFSLENRIINDSIVLDFGSLLISSLSFNKVRITKPNTVVEVKCGDITFATAAVGSHNVRTNPWILKLSCTNSPATVSEFTRQSKVTRIIGAQLTTTAFGSGTYRQFNSTSLVEFYLVPNKVSSGEGGINTGVLVDASIVSVANALKGGLATAQTLTISNATTKAKCSTIMGTVSQVTDGDETYDFFTQDQENGTVTLADFITTTKGWTLA